MARMYSGKHGKSGSKKPLKKVRPSWLRYENKEIEQLILKLAKSGKTTSEIGIVLRDSYGVPDVRRILKKKMTKVLEENKIKPKLPEDLVALVKKDIRLVKHFKDHKKDMTVKRGLRITESKIEKLAKYYKRVGELPTNWKYDRSNAKLLIE